MDTLFEILKTLGALAGLASGAFLVWDRFTKHYPQAIIVARPLSEGSAQIVSFLMLKNLSDRPILVRCNPDDHRPGLRIMKGQSVRDAVFSSFGHELRISLGPQSVVYLPVVRSGRYQDIDFENCLVMELHWKFAQPILWNAERRVKIWIRKRDFESLFDDHVKAAE
jgi:hypothetical protein